jgi:dTDP-4-amino-4,6-dideoxygalactose transaminase
MQFVDLHAQYLSIKDEIDTAIEDVIRTSSFIRGSQVEKFEENFANLLQIKHCVSCANGTDALYITMKALGVEPGDEVITTAHSWISTSETITQAGGQVVFCDTEEQSFCIDPKKIEDQISPRTKGIIVVHLYGQPADMDSIMSIARKHGLWVIEDCAQSHLAAYNGKQVGTFGDAATFSFYPGKNLGAMGDAGGIVTNSDQIASFCETFARHGGKGEHVMEGINSRMDGLQAAILNVKLPHLPEWTRQRQLLAKRYDEQLSDVLDIVCPSVRPNSSHVYHLYVIRTPHRDELRGHLDAAEIPTVINYSKALPFYPAYQRLGHTTDDFPVAFQNASQILSLPLYPEMPHSDIDLVAEQIAAFMNQKTQRVVPAA